MKKLLSLIKKIKKSQTKRSWSCDACGGDSDSGCLSSGECYR